MELRECELLDTDWTLHLACLPSMVGDRELELHLPNMSGQQADASQVVCIGAARAKIELHNLPPGRYLSCRGSYHNKSQ